MEEDKIEVRSATPERLYVKVYKDFLATKHLTAEEKLVYIALKSFVDFRHDEGQVFPSMETLCQLTSLSRPRATRAISGLIKKGVVEKERRGLTKTNLYTVYDNPAMWAAETAEDMAEAADYKIPYSTQELLEELERRGVVTDIKKGPASGTGQRSEADTSLKSEIDDNNNILKTEESQEVTLDSVKNRLGYDVLIERLPYDKKLVDYVIQIIYNALTSTKTRIRVEGEDRPAAVVKGHIMKLGYEDLIYVIEKYKDQTERIDNPEAYLLTILYKAVGQHNAEITNQVKRAFYELE